MNGKTGATHPLTSQVAGKRIRVDSQHAKIGEALLMSHPNGLTAYELSDGRIATKDGRPVSANQIATRLLEMRERGYVKYIMVDGIELVRPTTPGNTGLVQILSDSGLAQLMKFL